MIGFYFHWLLCKFCHFLVPLFKNKCLWKHFNKFGVWYFDTVSRVRVIRKWKNLVITKTNHLLKLPVFCLDLLPCVWVPLHILVPRIDNHSANFTEWAFTANTKQGSVKVWMIFPQVFFLFVPKYQWDKTFI